MPCEVSPTAAHAAEVSTTVTGQPHAIRSPYQSTDLSLGLAIKSSQMNPSILSRCRKQGAKAPSLSCATCSRLDTSRILKSTKKLAVRQTQNVDHTFLPLEIEEAHGFCGEMLERGTSSADRACKPWSINVAGLKLFR